MNGSDLVLPLFFALFAVGGVVAATRMWRWSPERFEESYLVLRRVSPYGEALTRGVNRAIVVGAVAISSIAVTLGLIAISDARRNSGIPESRILENVVNGSLILMFVLLIFWLVVGWFSWPRFLLIPSVRHEKSVWVVKREARAAKRATRAAARGLQGARGGDLDSNRPE